MTTRSAGPPPAVPVRTRIPGAAREILLVLLVGCVGIGFFHRATLLSGFDTVQADLGDSRLIVFLLDHWRRVFAGTNSWSSPTMFYPLKGTLGYSDMLLGMGIPYAGFRGLGLGLFQAANATLVLLSLLSYASAYWLLRRVLRISALPSVIGALFFAVAYPKFAEQGHFQLRFDFFQPLALGFIAPLWLEDRSFGRAEIAARLNGFLAMASLGAFTAFYHAWFLLFWVAVTALALAAFPALRTRTAVRFREGWKGLWQPVLLFALVSIPFFVLYLPARHAAVGRSWAVVDVPTAFDYLRVGPNHLLWGWTQVGAAAPIEIRLGMGFCLPLVLLAGWAWSLQRVARARGRQDQPSSSSGADLLAAGLLSALVITVLTIRWGPIAPWRAVYGIVPGASALMAVGRWVLTLILPLSILLSVVLDRAWRWRTRRHLVSAALAVLVLLGAAEQLGRIPDRYSGAAAAEYHRRIAAAIPASCDAFLLAPETNTRMLSRGQFDSAKYLAANPDVAKGWPGTAWEHYSQFGFREGRTVFSRSPGEGGAIPQDEFDGAKYLAANPDVAAGWHGTPWEHYVQFGFREGRSVDPNEAVRKRWMNFHYQVSALIASAISGKPTVNGASGLMPVGYPLSNLLVLNVDQVLGEWLQKFPGRRACLVKRALPPEEMGDELRKRTR